MFPSSTTTTSDIAQHYSRLFGGSPDFGVDVDDVSKSASLLRRMIGYLTTEDPEVNERRFEKLCEKVDMSSTFQVVGDLTDAVVSAHVRLEKVYGDPAEESLFWQTETQEDRDNPILSKLRSESQIRDADRVSRRREAAKAEEANTEAANTEAAKAGAEENTSNKDGGDEDGESHRDDPGAESVAASDDSDATIVPESHPRNLLSRTRKACKVGNSAVGE